MSVATKPKTVSALADSDMQAVPAALARAAQRAREISARTGTPLVIAENSELRRTFVPANVADNPQARLPDPHQH